MTHFGPTQSARRTEQAMGTLDEGASNGSFGLLEGHCSLP